MRRANRADISVCGFIVVRLPRLPAVRATDNERFIFFRFRHCLNLILMLSRFHSLGARQFSNQCLGIVDQHGEMLWTDPKLTVLIIERNEWNLIARAIADNALLFIGHSDLSSICCCVRSFLSDPKDPFPKEHFVLDLTLPDCLFRFQTSDHDGVVSSDG